VVENPFQLDLAGDGIAVPDIAFETGNVRKTGRTTLRLRHAGVFQIA
jgi:hypothetical protein